MDDDLGDIGRMHPAQHFCQIGDRASSQQALHGQEHDIGLGLPSIALSLNASRKTSLSPTRGFGSSGSDFRQFFRRLHH